MPLLLFFNVANMSFNAIRENKILAKISGFTIYGFLKASSVRNLRTLMERNSSTYRSISVNEPWHVISNNVAF